VSLAATQLRSVLILLDRPTCLQSIFRFGYPASPMDCLVWGGVRILGGIFSLPRLRFLAAWDQRPSNFESFEHRSPKFGLTPTLAHRLDFARPIFGLAPAFTVHFAYK